MKASSFRSGVNFSMSLLLLAVSSVQISVAQQLAGVVPTLVNFSGSLTDASGRPLTGTVGVTFYLYKDEQGGSPLWMETQNVVPDKSGHYTVVLGSTTSQGLPTSLFASGEARWLGVQAQRQAEQPRVLLLSVPYALKAGDAQTVGGLSPSAFMLAASSSSSSSSGSNTNSNAPPLSGTGKANYLPIWTNATTLGNSVLFQSGKGSTAQLGIGTTKPAATLDVSGSGTIRGLFSLPATGTATTKAGFNSQPIDLAASVFNSGTSTAVTQTFQWQAEPVANNTSNATGSLNLLFGQGTSKPSETGLNIASNGQITFAKGQTFPGTGSGTITGVTAGIDLTGGGNSGNVTLNLDTTKVPQLNAANTFTGNQTINGNVSDSGNISATGSITGQTGTFSANNGTQAVSVTQSGTGSAIAAMNNGSATVATILGNASNSAVNGIGVEGVTAGANGIGMLGFAMSTTSGGEAAGVEGYSVTPNGAGVLGISNDTTNAGMGLYAVSASPNGVGARGVWDYASTIGVGSGRSGVWGDSAIGIGLLGTSDDGPGLYALSTNYAAAWGRSTNGSGVVGSGVTGVYGYSDISVGVAGEFGVASNSGVRFLEYGCMGRQRVPIVLRRDGYDR
jgi:hypothetical protein